VSGVKTCGPKSTILTFQPPRPLYEDKVNSYHTYAINYDKTTLILILK
jgi:hypothetical protein